MFSITTSATLGIESVPVKVETDISFGMSNFTIVGLPDASVKESRDRIRSALKNSGFPFPRGRVTVNLAPADLRKQGPIFDVPIAISLLVSHGEIPGSALENCVVVGELALDGTIRQIRGALATALMTRRCNKTTIFVPKENANEVAVLRNLKVFGISSLKELVDHLLLRNILSPFNYTEEKSKKTETTCFSFIKGQELAKRGLEIAAAGGHNVLLSGPPGTGKTLLAKAFPSILPELTEEESIEVTSIASVAGLLKSQEGLIRVCPFRSPHHSSSAVALVGGGTWPVPGEISLAHRGVLFLDELPEFPRHVIEHLRQPLEDGIVTISRANATVKFPASFLLIAAMNPCPCGYLTDPKRQCICSHSQIHLYQKRISGPILDRFDLRIEVGNIPKEILLSEARAETSFEIQTRVIAARKKQVERFFNSTCHINAEIPPSLMDQFCSLSLDAKQLLSSAIETQSLSPRACMRVRKVARTIADLEHNEEITDAHLAEALQFREQPSFLQ